MDRLRRSRSVTLKQLTRRQRRTDIEIHGSSDRAAVLVLSAQLETLIDSLVRKKFVGQYKHGKHPMVDGPTAPIGSWYARNLLLLETGTISPRLWKDLETVRRIRNRFAHEWTCSSFKDARIQQHLLPMEGIVPFYIAPDEPNRDRLVFVMVMICLLMIIDDVRKATRARKPRREELFYSTSQGLRGHDLMVTRRKRRGAYADERRFGGGSDD